MSDIETKLRDCLQRTARAIRDYTTRPIPPAWRAVLQDIVETLHDVTKAILDNEPFPPGSAPGGAAPELDENTVVVGVHGGGVRWVQKGSASLRVIVRDYDTDGRDEGERGLQRDDQGDLYAEWEE
jgi:hypothetical protein